MPCHPEDKAVNKAMKRTNKRLSQAKLHSESLDNDDDVTERRDEMDGDEEEEAEDNDAEEVPKNQS